MLQYGHLSPVWPASPALLPPLCRSLASISLATASHKAWRVRATLTCARTYTLAWDFLDSGVQAWTPRPICGSASYYRWEPQQFGEVVKCHAVAGQRESQWGGKQVVACLSRTLVRCCSAGGSSRQEELKKKTRCLLMDWKCEIKKKNARLPLTKNIVSGQMALWLKLLTKSQQTLLSHYSFWKNNCDISKISSFNLFMFSAQANL